MFNVTTPRRTQPAGTRTQATKAAPLHLLSPADLVLNAELFMAKRQETAEAEVGNYELVFEEGFRYAQGVRKLSDGTVYLQAQDTNGETTCMCAHQFAVEAVNNANRAAGVTVRVACKHRILLALLEQEAREVAE